MKPHYPGTTIFFEAVPAHTGTGGQPDDLYNNLISSLKNILQNFRNILQYCSSSAVTLPLHMRSITQILLLSLAFVSLTGFKQATPESNEWVYEQEKKGIKIFTKKSKWGHLRDAKAVMTVATGTEDMLKLLTDFDHYKTWQPRCKESRVVARLSDSEFIVHLVFNAPWPLANRDCVMRVKVERQPGGTILITQTSEPKYIREEKDVVRIQQLVATWKLVPKTNGTEITNEYSSNPGGSIPDWMVNTQSVENPQTTFENIQQKVAAAKE